MSSESSPKSIAIDCMKEYQDQLIALFFEVHKFYESVDKLPDYLQEPMTRWVEETFNYQEYSRDEALDILDKYSSYRPTDDYLWKGIVDIDQISSCQAVYTFKSVVQALINKMMKALSDIDDADFEDYWEEAELVFSYENNEDNMETMGEKFLETIDQVSL